MLKYLIPLFVLLISPFAHAEKYDRDYRNNALGGIVSATEKRMEQMANDERMRKAISGATVNAEPKSSGTREIEIKKNYPVVPYDPNHPNVQKQKSSKFNISAKAKTLAGRFGRGLNALALGVAVADLIGEGIDWVLDPENNSVRYNTPDGYMWRSVVFDDGGQLYATKELAAKANCRVHSNCQSVSYLRMVDNENNYEVNIITKSGSEGFAWTVQRVQVKQEQSLSLDIIAQHVINNENVTNNITNNYYDAVNDTLIEQIQKGEHDDAIKEAIKRLQDDKTDTDTSTENKDEPDTSTENKEETQTGGGGQFPKFCEWAKPVCDFIEWYKEEPKMKPEQVPETDIQLKTPEEFDKKHINIGGSCPADVVANFNTGFAQNQIRFEMQPICNYVSNYFRPVVIFIAYIWVVIYIGGAFKVS